LEEITMANDKITAIVDALKELTVLELSELVSAVEEEFGLIAAAAVAVAAPAEGS
jgi:large subunit ribosomal protein L7/L12